MPRILLINAAESGEVRAALVADGRLEEFLCERASAGALLGNIYKGRVVNLERSIGAAFVDIGVGRNGFLHASDCVGASPEVQDQGDIEAFHSVGDEVIVQATRESIGAKGPVLTGQISFPGRFLVLLPLSRAGGVSRRIPGEEDRNKLRNLVHALEERAGAGVIVRTAGASRTSRELLRDLRYLRRLWMAVAARAAAVAAPALLHAERDLPTRALRDLVDPEVAEICVDTPELLERARETIRVLQPEMVDRLHLHNGSVPLFHLHGIETQIDLLGCRAVPLPCGGSVVFDRTEALVAVDVNSGRARQGGNLEETALQTNLEACGEIARQLRLRDLGGVVAVDFIDMRSPGHVRQVEAAFKEHLLRDRARVRIGRLGAFGVCVLTRRRSGAGGGSRRRRPCPRCGGRGTLAVASDVALRVFRELRARAAEPGAEALRVRVSPPVAAILEGERGGGLAALEAETGRGIEVVADPALPTGGWQVATAPVA